MTEGEETILIFRIGSIGDTIVALPCFHQIARYYRDRRRVLVTNISESQKAAPVESVLGNGGFIHDAIYFPSTGRQLTDILALNAKIRTTKASTLIYLADRGRLAILRDVLFFRTCGIREIIGGSLGQDILPRIDVVTGIVEPEAERLARCLSALGPIDPSDPAMWDLRLSVDERQTADRALESLGAKPFIALNFGGKVASKDWGDDNWGTLLRLLAQDLRHFSLVFVGSRDEHKRSHRLGANWPGTVLNLCGRMTPRETAAAMRNAHLFIGHDSGPMHLAAAVDVRCVCMFGDFNKPRVWYPYGNHHRIIHNMHGVTAVSPKEVYAAVMSVINKVERIVTGPIGAGEARL